MTDRFRSSSSQFETRKHRPVSTGHYNFQAPVEEFFVSCMLAVTCVSAVIIIAIAL